MDMGTLDCTELSQDFGISDLLEAQRCARAFGFGFDAAAFTSEGQRHFYSLLEGMYHYSKAKAPAEPKPGVTWTGMRIEVI